MATVSVIVPVYQAERYLSACVESILQQSFQDFEIILVDDGSPDGSGKICDEYAEKEPRIRDHRRLALNQPPFPACRHIF